MILLTHFDALTLMHNYLHFVQRLFTWLFATVFISLSFLQAEMRIKDLAMLEGRRDNQLVGYGLVVGLAGDGDSNQALYTVQSVANTLERFGVSVDPGSLISKNVAAVMLTANIPAYAEQGSKIDVTISSIGDADSLSGGTLLQTPLLGADDSVYAVAQGSILLGGFFEGGGDATLQKNHPTVGTIPDGAIVEAEIPTTVIKDGALTYLLKNPDYASAVKLAERVNDFFPNAAQAYSPQGVRIRVPDAYDQNPVPFIASVESIKVEPDVMARVVMNERTGTIVATSAVRLSEIAVSHGNITVNIAKTPVFSQPNALAGGTTLQDEVTNLNVTETQGGFTYLNASPTLQELTTALNALGISPRDMMVILQTINKAGALHAELIME
jgi:flagellar P-ring protein precursor FlgI